MAHALSGATAKDTEAGDILTLVLSMANEGGLIPSALNILPGQAELDSKMEASQETVE